MSRGAVSGKLLFVSGVTPSVEPLLPLPTLSSYTVALVIPTTDTGIPLLFAVALARPTVFSTPIFHVISPTEYNSRVQRSSHNARMDSLVLPDPRLLSFLPRPSPNIPRRLHHAHILGAPPLLLLQPSLSSQGLLPYLGGWRKRGASMAFSARKRPDARSLDHERIEADPLVTLFHILLHENYYVCMNVGR